MTTTTRVASSSSRRIVRSDAAEREIEFNLYRGFVLIFASQKESVAHILKWFEIYDEETDN